MPYADKEAQKEYVRKWAAKRRADFFDGKSCVRCGSVDRLELDHIDRNTKVTNSIWTFSEKRREQEIAKCQVLCYTCHKEKTKDERAGDRKHGRTMYKYGCRCGVCKEVQRLHNAQRS